LTALPAGSGTDSPTVLHIVASFEDQTLIKKGAKKVAPQANLSMEMFRELTAAVSPSEIVASIVESILGKRKESPETVKGKGRAKKRRNSLPVDGEDETETPTPTPEPSTTTRVLRPRPQKKISPAESETKSKGKAKQESK
jgi:hypothetical protein